MAVESILLHTRDKRTFEGEAEVKRLGTGARVLRAGAILVGGLVLGVGSVVIPVVHLISTWLLPILGLIGAVVAFRVTIKVPEIRMTCPECAKAGQVVGGAWEDPLWVRCPHCQLPLRVELVAGTGS